VRGLGLTLAEIRELDAAYLAQPDRWTLSLAGG
jgi:hypothetical protein